MPEEILEEPEQDSASAEPHIVLEDPPWTRARLRGRVVDGTGAAVEGARLVGPRRTRNHYQIRPLEVVTDAHGAFEWSPGRWGWGVVTMFTVRADGWATRAFDRHDLDQGQWDVIEEGGEVEGVVVILSPGLTVEGTVVDEEGEPIAGVFVIPSDSPISIPGWEVEDPWDALQARPSGQEGRFRLESLDPLAVKCVFASRGRQVTGPYALNFKAVAEGCVTLKMVVPTPRLVEVQVSILQSSTEVIRGLDDEFHRPGVNSSLFVGELENGWHRLYVHGPLGCAGLDFEVPADRNTHALQVDPERLDWTRDPRACQPCCPYPPPPDCGTPEGE